MNRSTPGTALVTGASTGIGAVYADRLARRGYDLILVARSKEKLDALARRITNDTGRVVQVVVADLTRDEDIARVEGVIASTGNLSLLLNNAGIGFAAPLLQADVRQMVDMITLNVTALTRLTYKAVPGMGERGGGTVINVSSIAAVYPEVLNGVYGGTKAFVLALSQSMHHELADNGIRVQAVLPGATETEFFSAFGVTKDHLEGMGIPLMSAADMVDASLVGLDAGELVTLPTVEDKALVDGLENARRATFGQLANAVPASRYGVGKKAA